MQKRLHTMAYTYEDALQPVIFLDFDGPLRNNRARACGFEIDPIAATVISQQLEKCSGRIVISSSWRHHGWESCVPILNGYSGAQLTKYISQPIWCINGDEYEAANGGSAGTRADNIRKWIEKHGDYNRTCIIDDYDMSKYIPVVTHIKATEKDGINADQLRKLIEWADKMKYDV